MKYFGTDGIRGAYNESFLNDSFAEAIGRALGTYLQNTFGSSNKVLLARDTRPSGISLLNACTGGLQSSGIECLDAGVIPTPALAYGVCQFKAQLGIMITASHNPSTDNGIKIFSHLGTKLSPEQEAEIENILLESSPNKHHQFTPLQKVDVLTLYIDHILQFFPSDLLKGLRIAVDLANGATSKATPIILEKLGAEIFPIHSGDGIINSNCGSEFPASLQEEVKKQDCDLGIGHDGDGDRMIIVDSSGHCIHGDQILGLLALDAFRRKDLKNNALIATIHSNSGLEASLKDKGISLYRSDVGDRNVKFLMEKVEANLGGESSGHIIFKNYLPTGDGIYAALATVRAMIEQEKSIRNLAEEIELWPSVSRSFTVKSKPPLSEVPNLSSALSKEEEALGDRGRILLRYSGTEQKIRLLVEGKSKNAIEKVSDRLSEVIQIEL